MSKLELIQKINLPIPRYWNLCLDDFYGPREVLMLPLTASPALHILSSLTALSTR